MNNVLMRQGVDMKPRKQINQDKMICPDCGKSKSRVMPYCDDCLGKHLITCDDCRSQIERDIIDACFKYLVPKLKRWEAWSNPDGSVGFRCSNPHLVKGLEFPIETKAETLSVALRLALEKLIKEK